MLRENPTEKPLPNDSTMADGFDMAAYRLRLVDAEKTFDQQVPLDEVALCCRRAGAATGLDVLHGMPTRSKMRVARRDPAIYVAGSLDVARYVTRSKRFRPDARDADGSVLVRSYLAGQTVGERRAAPCATYPRMRAARNGSPSFTSCPPPQRSSTNRIAAAFWSIGRREAGLDTVLLIPAIRPSDIHSSPLALSVLYAGSLFICDALVNRLTGKCHW